LLAVLMLVPLIELIVLIQIGRHLGALETIALVIAAGLLGAFVAMRAGVRAIGQVQADIDAGRVPADSLLDGLIVLAIGLMLITPGFVTDVIGLILLLAPVRTLIRNYVKSRLRGRMVLMQGGQSASAGDWVDVEPRSAHDVEPPRAELP
jgi:UPF0716 protein FxsA